MKNYNKFKQFLDNQFFKKMIRIPVLVLVTAVLILIIFNFFLRKYAGNLKGNAEQGLTKSFEDIYNDDVFGGSIPEETLGLFLDALQKDDLTLASQYFVTGNIQNQIYAYLRKISGNGTIKSTAEQWSQALKNGKGLNDGINRYVITYQVKILKASTLMDYTNGRQFKLGKGKYTNIIYFIRNKSNIWKILSI
ncbi:hypothetical protein HY061_03130 [Candidatus Azambacteria bacterium]|nr:hypothetical protein [Candidatus Azambacteria bacterium]